MYIFVYVPAAGRIASAAARNRAGPLPMQAPRGGGRARACGGRLQRRGTSIPARELLAVYLDAKEVFPATDRTAFLSSLLDAAADYCRRADIRSGFIIRKGSYTRLFSEVLQAELLGFVMDHFYPIPHTSSRQRTRYAASPWHDALQATGWEAYLWQVAISARAGALRGNHGALYSVELHSQSRLSVTGGGGGQSGESPCRGRPGCILLNTAQRNRRGTQGNPNRMAQVRSI
jgi:hypothetical protein